MRKAALVTAAKSRHAVAAEELTWKDYRCSHAPEVMSGRKRIRVLSTRCNDRGLLAAGRSFPYLQREDIDKSLTSAVWSEVVDVRDTSPTAEAISAFSPTSSSERRAWDQGTANDLLRLCTCGYTC